MAVDGGRPWQLSRSRAKHLSKTLPKLCQTHEFQPSNTQITQHCHMPHSTWPKQSCGCGKKRWRKRERSASAQARAMCENSAPNRHRRARVRASCTQPAFGAWQVHQFTHARQPPTRRHGASEAVEDRGWDERLRESKSMVPWREAPSMGHGTKRTMSIDRVRTGDGG